MDFSQMNTAEAIEFLTYRVKLSRDRVNVSDTVRDGAIIQLTLDWMSPRFR